MSGRSSSQRPGRRVLGAGLGVVLAVAGCDSPGSPPSTTAPSSAASADGSPSSTESDEPPTLTIEAPDETRTGSVIATIHAPPDTVLRITGGVLPVTTAVGADGRVDVEVALFPDVDHRITANVLDPGTDSSRSVTVRQHSDDAAGVVTGVVVGSDLGPLPGATVSFGTRTAVTDSSGAFELTGLPPGTVTFQVQHAGHLGSVGRAVVVDGRGEANPVVLTALAEGVDVGPEGATIEGDGWRVEIPPHALDAPTSVRATPLDITGLKDTVGIPVLDLSPTGLTFATPITVALDPGRFGLAGARAAVVGFDPEELTLHELTARDADGWFAVELTTLNGMELRLSHETALELWGGMSSWCQPFNQVQAAAARTYLRTTLLGFLELMISDTSASAYARYLSGGVADGSVWHLPDAHDEFRTAPENEIGLDGVLEAAARNLPPLLPPWERTVVRLEMADPQEGYRDINYPRPYSTPGNLAGGTGAALLAGVTFPDERQFTGPAELLASVDDHGVIEQVDMVSDVRLRVRDAIDFCPSGMGNSGAQMERHATLPLSRLEVTPDGDDGATWARRYLWTVEVDLGVHHRDVTSRFENDPDGDGWPDTPPWPGWADGPLDNCPGTANPDQIDGDDDGAGDVCDDVDDSVEEADETDDSPTVEFVPDVDCVADQFGYRFDELADIADPYEIEGPAYGVVYLKPDGTVSDRDATGRMIPLDIADGAALITGPFFADHDIQGGAGTITLTAGEFELTGGRYAECATWDWVDDSGDRHTFNVVLDLRDDLGPDAADIVFVYGLAQFPAGDTSFTDGDLAGMMAAVAGWSEERWTIGDRQIVTPFLSEAVRHSVVATETDSSTIGVYVWRIRPPDTE